MLPGFDNFNPSCTQKSCHIVVPRLASVPHKLPNTIGHRHTEMTSALLPSSALRITQLSVSVISVLKFKHTYFTISAKTKLYKNANGQNNDDKAKKPTLGSHSISINYCNILAYFCITHNKCKASLTVLSYHIETGFQSVFYCFAVALCPGIYQFLLAVLHAKCRFLHAYMIILANTKCMQTCTGSRTMWQ